MQPACHTSFLSTVCTVYASLFIIQPVLADDQREHNNLISYVLPTITVIASKPNKDLVNNGILRQPQLDTIQSNNIVSLLEYLPGTSMVGSPQPGGEKINIWGLSDPEDVPVSVDGSLKTFDKYRQGFVLIEPKLIKKITVSKGPHNPTVSNGDFGGSIKLDASDFLRKGENIGALIKYAHASNNIQNNWSGALFAQSDNRMFDILTYYTKGN